ncbi:MAG: hypothetical protein WCS40_03810 [Methanomethylophilus sp.]
MHPVWYRTSVPLPTIAYLVGHTNVKTTMKCLDLAMEDLNNGASQYNAYFEQISERVRRQKEQ